MGSIQLKTLNINKLYVLGQLDLYFSGNEILKNKSIHPYLELPLTFPLHIQKNS
jgi:hypothetical protein